MKYNLVILINFLAECVCYFGCWEVDAWGVVTIKTSLFIKPVIIITRYMKVAKHNME